MKGLRISFGAIAVAGALALSGAIAEKTEGGSAIAATGEGFVATDYFPSHGTQWDGYAHQSVGYGVDDATLNRLWNHVAFPQSEGAMVSLLGWPDEWSGHFAIYSRQGRGDKLAVYYLGDQALWFTLGHE